jgi:hypothetical protein
MVRRVQNAPPEDPDALSVHIEERYNFHPPRGFLLREETETRERKLNKTRTPRFDVQGCRQHVFGYGLGRVQEFAEEAALREKLVLEDVAHGA